MYRVVESVGYRTRLPADGRIVNDNTLLRDSGIFSELTQYGNCRLRRLVNIIILIVYLIGIVEIYFDGNLLSLPITVVTTAERSVVMLENLFPCHSDIISPVRAMTDLSYIFSRANRLMLPSSHHLPVFPSHFATVVSLAHITRPGNIPLPSPMG